MACHVIPTRGGAGGLPPARCHATTPGPRRSRRWPPTKPAAPVTRIAPGMGLTRHSAHRAAERREVAETREAEREEEPVVRRDREAGGDAAVVEPLVVERNAAALRVVERRYPLVEDLALCHVPAERVDGAERVVPRMCVRLRVDGL